MSSGAWPAGLRWLRVCRAWRHGLTAAFPDRCPVWCGLAVRVKDLAAERRRTESLLHGVVSWGMSLLLAGVIALFASGVAAFTRTPVGNPAAGKGTRAQTAALVATTGNGQLIAISATGGVLLALVASLLASAAAAGRSSGVPFTEELRRWRRGSDGDRLSEPPLNAGAEGRRDQTTILPPTH